MPFVKRSVEPKCLSRKPLDDSVKNDELEAVTNNTLVEALKQLACLVLFADEIFQDLTSQVKVIHSRTEVLKTKLANVDDVVSNLNAKQVVVPVGTLSESSRISPHFVAPQPVDRGLFTASTRPAFVHRLYDSAIVSPVCVMRQIDRYRQDGRRSSKCFLCLPFFKDIRVNFDVEIEMRRPASLSTVPRDWLSEDDTLDSIVISTQTKGSSEGDSSSLSTDNNSEDDALRQLPTPEEKTYVMSLKYPYSDVPIDVTGTGFRRMTSLRRSFIQQMENMAKRGKKRSKRRNTVSGNIDNKELEAALQRASKKKNVNLSTSGTQTGDGEYEPGTSSSSRQSHVCFEESPKTSSKSQLNSLNRNKKSLLKKNNNGSSAEKDPEVNEKSAEGGSSAGFRWFQRRSRNRNSIIGGIGIYEELDRVKKSRRSLLASLLLPSSAAAEDKSAGSSPSKSSTDSAVASCSSGVSRRTTAKNAKNRSSLPISTLSQTMSTAVKMRENSARGKEDGGQSSSGNWSASSSTRTSMESEEPLVQTPASPHLRNRTGSQTSLSKDSALSDRMTPNDERWQDSTNGYHSDSTYSSLRKPGIKFTRRTVKTDTARWLRSLEEEGALGRSAGETTDAASSTGTLTPRIHRRALSPLDVPLTFVDDGESSEFSVDNDGYYTSMHTDSGLRAVPLSKFPNGGSTFGKASRLSDLHEQDQGSQSSACSLSSSSKASSKKAATSGEDTSNKDSTDAPDPESPVKKKIPPQPPPRTSTLSKTAAPAEVEDPPDARRQREGSPAESQADLSTSDSTTFKSDDSEAEIGTQERLKMKTTITTGRIPSLCVVTPSQSDDEEEKTATGERQVASHCSPPPWMSAPGQPSANRTLPKSFGRSSAIAVGGGAATNTWPRRPSRLFYEPELATVAERVSKADSLPATNAMTTFTRPSGDARAGVGGASRIGRPNSIAFAPEYPERSSPLSPLASCGPVISGQNPGSAGRQGARVTLDSTGQVIHSTGSLPRRSGGNVPKTTLAASEATRPAATAAAAAYIRADVGGSTPAREELQKGTQMAPVNCGMVTLQMQDPARNRCQLSPQQPPQQVSDPNHGQLRQRPPATNHSNASPSGWSQMQQQQPPRQYDSNTLPRWKPNLHDRPVPVFPSAVCRQNGNGSSSGIAAAAGYPSGSLPRRWNNFNFLRREPQLHQLPHQQMHQPSMPSTPSTPEPLATSKTGAYVRLDGHPAHLEPGTPSKVDSEAVRDPRRFTIYSPPSNMADRHGVSPIQNHHPGSAAQRLFPSSSIGGQTMGGSPTHFSSSGGQYGIAAPPAAMPLMQQLSYRPSRIPLVPSGRGAPDNGLPDGRAPDVLPPYYRPVGGTGPPTPEGGNFLSRSLVAATSPPPPNGYPARPQSEGSRIPAPAKPLTPPPYKQPLPPPAFVRSMSTPPGDPRRHGWNGLTHLTIMNQTQAYVRSSPSPMNCVGLPTPGEAGSYSSRTPPGAVRSPAACNGQQPSFAPQPHPQTPHLPACNGMQRARTLAGDLDTSVRPTTTPTRTPPPCIQWPQNGPPSPARHHHHPSSSSPSTPPTGHPVPPPLVKPLAARSTMSTDDLFAAIHHSKKKMKVKTDLDRSLSPTSSRSSSPAFSVSSLKCRKPETGTLMAAGDRRSWAGDHRSSPVTVGSPTAAAANNSPGDRRSWASDRLGPTRPTSMHDFKILLLQAGRGSPKETVPVKRLLASEMLRSASPARSQGKATNSGMVNPGTISPRMVSAGKVGNGMVRSGTVSPGAVSPGMARAGTVNGTLVTPAIRPYGPIRNRLQNKQGRHCRMGASVLHNRTDILSTPIMEDDCSEEEEDSESDGQMMAARSVRC